MIKFNCIIHKETGTVIKYEDWLEMHYSHSTIEIIKRCYDSDRMLFGSDFEIIYDSEFTESEIIGILSCVSCAMAESQGKEVESILKRIKERYKDNSKIMEEYESIVDEYMFEEYIWN